MVIKFLPSVSAIHPCHSKQPKRTVLKQVNSRIMYPSTEVLLSTDITHRRWLRTQFQNLSKWMSIEERLGSKSRASTGFPVPPITLTWEEKGHPSVTAHNMECHITSFLLLFRPIIFSHWMTKMKMYIVSLLIILGKRYTTRLRHQCEFMANRIGSIMASFCRVWV